MPQSGTPPFPWVEVMGFGFGVLRLSSKTFWSMSPREINAAYTGIYGTGNQRIARQSLVDMIERFPDVPKTN